MRITLNGSITLEIPATLTPTESAFIRAVIAGNTFKNPAVAEAVKQGRSPWSIPPEVCTFLHSRNKDRLFVQRGFLAQMETLASDHGIELAITDRRGTQERTFPALVATLRPYQARAVGEAMAYPQGIVESPTGSGKTLIGLELIRRCGQRTLVLVHTKGLADQWHEVIKRFLGIEAGRIGGGKWQPGEQITVAMLQTLSQREEATKDLAQEIGLVLVDEVHHIPAATFLKVVEAFPAKYRYGLSATPIRRDGLHVLINRAVGDLLTEVDPAEVQATGATVPAKVWIVKTGVNPGPLESWSEFVTALAGNEGRNNRIASFANRISGKSTVLVLVDRVAQAETLAALTGGVLAHGQLSKAERQDAFQAMETAPLTVGTCAMLGEGLDVSAWQTLILAAPISSEVKLRQAIGRVVRPAPGKTMATVYDLVDDCAFSWSSLQKRKAIYTENQIQFGWYEPNRHAA